jgi:hypothetical protein
MGGLMLNHFANVCEDCLLFNGSVFYLLYAALVLVASLAPLSLFEGIAYKELRDAKKKTTPFIGELGVLRESTEPRQSISAQLLLLLLGIASFNFFQLIVRGVLSFIRTVFLMRDHPSFLLSAKRYLIFYLVVIPLPAAFMAPVTHTQRQPDFQLLSAVILLIVANALGDAISIRLTLKNFDALLRNYQKYETQESDAADTNIFLDNVKKEALYYLAVAKGALYSLVILIVVLAISSVLYGVQIGEFDFSLSSKFFAGAWHRVLQFPGLAFEMYWFRGQLGPFGLSGIPGIFLFGLTTFIPIIALFCAALLWLFLLPLRIAVNLPSSRFLRVVSSEFMVGTLCVVLSYTFQINVLNFYTFLMHTWITW